MKTLDGVMNLIDDFAGCRCCSGGSIKVIEAAIKELIEEEIKKAKE